MSNNLPLPELPQEIITNILSRLPVESLLRFKCVSKPWLSLISTPGFAKSHLKQLKENNTVTYRVLMSTHQSLDLEAYCDDSGYYQSAKLMEHDPINDIMGLGFVGSCDGLICGACGYRYVHLIVVNPTTRQVRELPVPEFTDYARQFCGFAYDSKIDDYKIVRGVIFTFAENGFCIEIFNLKCNSWRTIQNQHWGDDSDLFFGKGVFLNGFLHWLNRKVRVYDGDEYIYEIVRFDVVLERFLDVMPLPNDIDHPRNLTVIDECLCVYTQRSETFSAWKMMDYGDQNSWQRIYQISNDIFYQYGIELLYVTKTGQLLFEIDKDYLLLYNPRDEKIKQFGYENEDFVERTVFVESLVSPTLQIEMTKQVQQTTQFVNLCC